ncbi:hypothetical protein BKA62DRAFT_776205 [Auriculariales sp. MPI-PUGE-AT-0066]|nr:hypothetical protein BKA62DRAFT_776205 [Auriculariales sp. MPI-PUGE-AT-0066]
MASAPDTGTTAHSTDAPLPESVQALRTSVRALSASVEILLDRKTTMFDTKESIKQIVDSGDRIVTAVDASCQQLATGHVPIIANSLITVTREMVAEWTRFMGDRAIKTPFNRFLLMNSTNSYLASFRDAITVIEDLFKIENGIAQAIVDPEGCFNLRFAKPASAVSMANMTDGAPWPWKAIPQTLLQFTTMVERSLDNPKKIQDLSDKIGWRIALLLNISEKHGRSDDQLERCVETFLCDAQRIIIRLRIIEKVRPAKAFPLTEYISKIIDDEALKMQEAHKQLESQFLVKTTFTVMSIADGVASVEKTLIEIRDGVRVLLGTHAMEATHHVHAPARLPGRPEVLNGRTDEVNEYVELLCGCDPEGIAIIGPGGIGKTSLARALLHHRRVVAAFKDRRFFVSVEGVIDMESAAVRLANALGLPPSKEPLETAISYLHKQSPNRVLLVIDNFETLWFHDDRAAETDTVDLFQRLQTVPSLTLIVTCRSGVSPNGVSWSTAKLQPIALSAAHATFVHIAGAVAGAAEERSLSELLRAVDCVPLAVTLLARLAKVPGNPPSSLLQRWHSEHTKMTKTSDRDRESSVEISIQVSLDLLARTSAGKEAAQLLIVCAYLPDGLRPTVFEQMADSISNISEAKNLLLTFALVSLGGAGELIMLSPVRHFVLSQSTTTGADYSVNTHLAALRTIYFRIAATAPQEPSEDFTSRVSAFAPEYGNLSSYLLHLIRSEEPSQDLFDAVNAAANYSYLTNPSTALLDAFRPRLEGHSRWLADCLAWIGRIRLHRCEYALCMESLIQARVLYEDQGNVDHQIWCACLLAQSLDACGRSEDAEQELLAAQALLSKSERSPYKYLVHRDLGRIYFGRKEYEAATDHFVTAKDECLRTAQRLYAAHCSQWLAGIAVRQGRLPAAELDIQLALSEFEALGDLLGAGQCFVDLGQIKYLQSDLESAATLFARAEVTLASVGDPDALARCHWWLGKVYRDQGRKKDALDKFDASRILWESIDAKNARTNAEYCSQEIAKLKA